MIKVISSVLFAAASSSLFAADHPNIVLIYADDLGYGDVGAYGATHISTPQMDRIAREGMKFTSGYATSATCTPSRYSLLTGEYAWRREGTGIAAGDAKLIVEPGRTTLPGVLKQAGYRTGVVGKWHLGLGGGGIDWNQEVTPGPLDVGFDECFIMAATGDRVPCVFIRDRKVVNLDPTDPIEVSYKQPFPDEPIGRERPDLLTMRPSHGHDMAVVNGVSRIGYMRGGKSALWKDEEMAAVFTAEAVKFIGQDRARPFFLLFALHDPHVPRMPHPRFVGKSGLGPRGDAILQADWSVGEILATLDRLKLADDTLVILTSDNGPVLDDGYHDKAVELNGAHTPSGPFRGGKYSRFEAGCRVPLLIRWPAEIKPGTSDAIVSQVDFLASFSTLTGRKPSDKDAPDSVDMLPALLGKSPVGRTDLVQHGTKDIALRSGQWKFHPPSDAPALNANTRIETGNSPEPQLYDLEADPGERRNVAADHPGRVEQLAAKLDAIRNSHPAGKQRHDN